MQHKQIFSRFITLIVILSQVLAAVSGVLPAQVASAATTTPALAQPAKPVEATVERPLDTLARQTETRQSEPRTTGATMPELARPAANEVVAAVPLAANTASLTGIVYQDYNANGVRDTTGTVIDKGVGGVTIKAYDASGAVVGTATSFAVVCLGANNPAGQGCTAANTPALGSYTLSALPASTALRVEFSSLPTGYYPAPVGTNNATSVRFVTTTTGVTSGIDFGLLLPLDYSQASPNLVTPLYVNGDTNITPPTAALVKFAYNSSGTSPAPTTLATKAQIGSTWGLAYARSTQTIYAAAFLKRHVGLGPNGPGAIYAVNINGGTPTLFADLATWGANIGAVPSNSTRNLGAPTAPNNDAAVVDQVGKVGLGDIDIADDDHTLYVVSLNDKTLYALNVPAGTLAGSYAIPDPGCTGGAWRPFATKYKNGAVYVGGVCDAQSSQSAADLKAYIYRFTPGSNTFTPVFNFLLNYTKGRPEPNECPNVRGWYPWLATLPTSCGFVPGYYALLSYPQPMLSDIEFDLDGSMMLGFMDRLGHQAGYANYALTGTTLYMSTTGGDLLRVNNNHGTYVLENNGVAGSVTTAGANNSQGPGGGEFYYGDNYGQHQETVEGGLAFLPGSGEVAVTSMDPSNVITSGVYWYSNTTGNSPRRYQVVATSNVAGFGKANGIGDLEVLADLAPIEIGNRVWNDANGNGVQDPGEAGISGVVVNLVTITGTVMAAATTDANGNYYFSSATGTSTTSAKYGLSLNRNSAYQVQIANATGASQQTALAGMLLTTPNADSATNNDSITDVRDSDGVISGTLAVITYTTGGPGENNHGLDFGFYTYGTIQVVKQTFGGDGTFTFSSTDSTFNSLSLTTSNGIASSTVFTKPIGSYIVTENAQANWNLVGLWCNGDTDNGSTLSVANRQTTLDLDKGENLVCTFANSTTPPIPAGTGVLTVTKTVNWNSNTPDPTKTFNINITGPSYPSGKADMITAGATNVYTGLVGGVYTITEISPGAGWVTTYSVPSGVVNLATPVAATTAGPISGNVFRDYNADGVDAGTSEPGVAGLLVTAYDPNGLVVGVDSTDASGNYSFTPSKPGPYRVELQSTPSGYYVTKHGAGNGTSTQFVTNNGGASNVNFGVNAPADYSQANPDLVTNLYINGDTNTAARTDTLVKFAYNSSGTAPTPTTIATKAQIGSTWGVAYARSTKMLYAAAFLKRHVGLGPNGAGAIYAINTVGGTPRLFADLTALGANVGTVLSNNTRGLGAPTAPSNDPTTYSQIGKVGLGDIDISDDERTLYVLSLNDRRLYALNVPAATLAGSYAIPDPGCTGGAWRPFALKTYSGNVYVGGVCDAQVSQQASDLRAYVYRFTPSATLFTSVLSFPLNYPKGTVPECPTFGKWNPWLDTIPPTCNTAPPYIGIAYPQPLLSDIEIDVDGSLILGFTDRSAEQGGVYNYGPTGTQLYVYRAYGEILRAALVGGSYILENNGTAGSLTTTGANNGQGPGGGEFYYADSVVDGSREAALGGLALKPGSGEVVSTLSDPINMHSNGVRWFNNTTGNTNRSYQVYASSNLPTFDKAAGLGDLELLFDPAPLEIGNRVWKDLNGNGVQDPGEPGLANVTVSLQSPTNTVTTNTDANGLYYFTVSPNTAYTLTINPSQAALNGLTLTQANMQAVSGSTTSNDALLDTRDSDAVTMNGKAAIFYTTGLAGQNNHGLDFGWTQLQFAGSVTIGNTAPQVGIIVIHKATLPAGSGQTFTFTSNVPGYANFTLSDGGAYTMTQVPVGTYAVTETASSGWTQAATTCTGGSTLGAVQVQWNNTTTCTIINALQPTTSNVLTVTKTVNWNGNTPNAGQTFNINITGPSFPNGQADTITAGQTKVYTNVVAGVYTVTETSPGAGWVTTYSVPGGVVSMVTPVATTTAGPISGKVYQDFNSNGQIDSGGTVNDVGIAGLTVAAYDPNGVLVGTATTNATGNYSFTPTKPGPYRVELQNAPADSYPTTHGAQNGTSVQFVTTNGGASNVNFGLNDPESYCQNNPLLCTSEMTAGDPANATTGAFSALKKWSYSTANGSVTPTTLANESLVGSVWGLAYARQADKLYSATFLKRHIGIGPSGLGAIYVTNNPRKGVGVSTALFFDVATIAGVNVGTVPSNSTRGLTTPTGTALDTAIYDKVGKVGLGDIDISDDESMLWTISLNDKKLIGLLVNNPSAATARVYTIPDPGCNAGTGDYRPFGLKYYHGQLYIGVTCDASLSLQRNDLKAVVYRFDPANAGVGFTNVLNVPLNYTKGAANTGCTSNPGARWFPWVNTPYPTGFNPACPAAGNKVLPQPLLSDLEFDVDGSLILGFMDRFANQTGEGIALPDGTNAGETMVGGDILRAWNNNGVLVLENNGTAGPVAGGVGNTQGPGGGEFYRGDFIASLPTTVNETANGALAFLPGSGEVVSTVWDPLTNDAHHGVAFLSNTNGNANRRHDIGLNTQFGKGSGLGDLELLCDSAPLEIGNRVWKDLNGNGVQDPGEPGLANVTVSLQSPTNTVTTNTAANGLYYFTVSPNTAYTLTINPSQAALSGLTLTPANLQAVSGSTFSNDAILDTRDSDAVTVNGKAAIFYTTGSAGQNNHGLDFGFMQPVSGKVTIGNTAPPVGALVIRKATTPAGSSQTFDFTSNVPGYTSFTLRDGDSYTMTDVPVGVYAVTETLPSGWTQAAATCTNVSTLGAVQVSANVTTICSVLNAVQPPPPTNVLTVTKTVNWNGNTPDAGLPFHITITGPSFPAGQADMITAGQTKVYTNVVAGVYTVTETSSGAGWTAVYTATPGVGGSSQAIVTLQNSNTAPFATTPISGKVFRDFNSDGQITTGTVNDTGMNGVTVTAYDQNGNAVGSATSDANGNYTINPSGAGPYRVEFSNRPSGYEPSRGGAQNGTSVQFINTAAQATGVNFGIVDPNDYSQNNPLLIVPMHTSGSGVNNTLPGLVTFPYDGSSPKTTVLQESQIGSAWGEGYQRSPSRLFVAAFMRRQVGFKDGPGYVYVLDRNGNTLSLAGSFDLQGIAPANGGPTIDLGSVCRRDNTDGDPDNSCLPLGGVAADYTLAAGISQPSIDLDAYAKVGKMSYGDIDVSEDGKTLWLTNLYQNALIRVDISGSNFTSGVKQYPLSSLSRVPTCGDFNNNGSATPTGDLHPFALKFYGGKGYLGVTCDAFNSRDKGDLRAFVLSFDPNNPTAGFTQVLTVPLDYWLHNTTVNKPHWLPWSSTWAQSFNNPDGFNGGLAPEPVLSDLEFSEDGSLIVGLMDRHANQQFSDNYIAASQTATIVGVYELGDILKFCHVAGSYVMEGAAASCPVVPKGAYNGGAFAGEGVSGNGEYFMEARADGYYEAFMGALALLPGSTDVVGTFVDPGQGNAYYYTGGTAWWQTTSPGSEERTYVLYPPALAGQPTPGYADKGNGLGDIELLVDPAPLEIGNRVWKDLNGNGVQDPGELGIANVTVSLQSPTNTVTTNTDANGLYYFTVSPNTAYTLTINPSQAALSGLTLTPANLQAVSGSTFSNDAILDTRDSDAVTVNGKANIFYTTGSAGQNNHGLDFGFTQSLNGKVTIHNKAPRMDYGDDPDQYDTTITNTGAAHIIIPGLHLGASEDTEVDGQPSTGANGDGADEDGVQFPPLTVGSTAVLTVTATNTGTTAATIYGWIDFNGDGQFTASERVTTTVPAGTTNGVFYLTYSVPANAVRATYARFRLSTDSAAAQPTGVALDGEVEDYPLTIQAMAQFGDRVWIESDADGLASTGVITPLAGMIITATDGTHIYTATTTAQGYYSFTVSPGLYTVSYGSVPAQYGTLLPSATPGGGTAYGNEGSYQEAGNPDESYTNPTTVGLAVGEANWHVDFAFHAPRADLRLIKQVNKTVVKAGDTLVYTLVLTNDGPDTASNVQVKDRLPAKAIYQSANAQQGTYDVNTGVWDVGTLVANSSVTITITVKSK